MEDLQDRLIAELSFNGIGGIKEANEYLKNIFIPSFNKRFSVEAEQSQKAYRKNVFGNLDLIFCKKLKRKVCSGNVFSWDRVSWYIDEKVNYHGREINVNLHLDGSYSFDIMGRKVECRIYQKQDSRGRPRKTNIKMPA